MDIAEIIGLPNIAKGDEDFASQIYEGYEIDDNSRTEWKKRKKEALNIANQVWEEKSYPFKRAANIKFPLLATSSVQFAARAYPNFVKGPDIVRALVVGDDPQGRKAQAAYRVSRHMSYQCLYEMEEWESDTDKLLTIIPIIGCAFKKSFYSPLLGRNVSEYRSAQDIIINYFAKSLETAPRITEEYTLYPNEIKERINTGIFLNLDYGTPVSTKNDEDSSLNDPDRPHVFLEQHTFLDLDKDGYKEPYIINIHKDTKQIARIVPRFDLTGIKRQDGKITRIEPIHYYTKFPFMPSLDGSIYDRGFDDLLTPINKTIDTTINQILDSGTLYNSNTGFIGKGIQLGRGRGAGPTEFELGEWKQIGFTGDDIRKNILPLPVKEPSQVLFSLLGFMVQAGRQLASVTEILTGDQSNEAERPTTTLARIEQGLMVFSSIYKRLYKAFRQEYKKLFYLNSKYLNPQTYFRVLDTPHAILQNDYDLNSCDVVPIADPSETTGTQKLIKAQILIGMVGTGMNDTEIRRRFLDALQEPEPEKLLNAPPPPPDPKFVIEQAKLQLEQAKLEFEAVKYIDEQNEINAKIKKTLAQALQAIAQAEAAEMGPQLDIYKTELQALMDAAKVENANQQARLGSVVSQRGNAGSVQNTA